MGQVIAVVTLSGVRDVPAEDRPLAAEPPSSRPLGMAQLPEIMATEMAQLDMLEIAPDPLVGVEVRGIAGQALQMQVGSRAF